MIVTPNNFDNATITVTTRGGMIYRNMNIPPDPFFQPQTVAFWHDDLLLIIPLSEVTEITFFNVEGGH